MSVHRTDWQSKFSLSLFSIFSFFIFLFIFTKSVFQIFILDFLIIFWTHILKILSQNTCKLSSKSFSFHFSQSSNMFNFSMKCKIFTIEKTFSVAIIFSSHIDKNFYRMKNFSILQLFQHMLKLHQKHRKWFFIRWKIFLYFMKILP